MKPAYRHPMGTPMGTLAIWKKEGAYGNLQGLHRVGCGKFMKLCLN